MRSQGHDFWDDCTRVELLYKSLLGEKRKKKKKSL